MKLKVVQFSDTRSFENILSGLSYDPESASVIIANAGSAFGFNTYDVLFMFRSPLKPHNPKVRTSADMFANGGEIFFSSVSLISAFNV